MGPTWVLLAPDGPHFGPMNLAIRGILTVVHEGIQSNVSSTYSVLEDTRALSQYRDSFSRHDDIIKWKHFPRYTGIHWSPGNSPHKLTPVTRSFDVFFDLRPNKRLSKQWWGWWFETPSLPLWRHCNGMGIAIIKITRSWDNLIFIMGMPILVRWCLYIATAHRCQFQCKDCLPMYMESHVYLCTSKIRWSISIETAPWGLFQWKYTIFPVCQIPLWRGNIMIWWPSHLHNGILQILKQKWLCDNCMTKLSSLTVL